MNKMRNSEVRTLLLLVLLTSLAGCASRRLTFEKAGVAAAELERDENACLRAAIATEDGKILAPYWPRSRYLHPVHGGARLHGWLQMRLRSAPPAAKGSAAGSRRSRAAVAAPATIAHSGQTRRELFRGALAVLAGGAWAPARPAGASGRALTPAARTVKAAYLSYYGVGDRAIRGHVLELLDRTELNAVVIDVKGDRGFIPYESRVSLARDAGAMGPVRVRDFDDILARLKARGVYTIARIVVFKDDVLARYRRTWAVTDTRTGSPWLDTEHLAWVDPFEEEAWVYPIAVAREAVLKGFDEIQFDYLRFPADGKLSAARYSKANTQENRLAAIIQFLTRARAALEPTGASLAIDLFGYTAFNLDDTGVGQRIEELAPLVDAFCPMAYPSAYHLGIPNYRNPVARPYEVVFETVRRVRERSAHARAQVRPWIQDFRDYAFDRRPFGVPEVRAQMKAALDAGATGWMLWNPHNSYTVDALAPPSRPRPG